MISDSTKNIRSAKNSTLLLMMYCLLMSVLLTLLAYAVDSGRLITDVATSRLLESPFLKTTAICNYFLLLETVIALITIYRHRSTYRIYQLVALSFILVRMAAVGILLYEVAVNPGHGKESQQASRMKIYAMVLGVFEVLIVVIQMGMLSKLFKKEIVSMKELSEQV